MHLKTNASLLKNSDSSSDSHSNRKKCKTNSKKNKYRKYENIEIESSDSSSPMPKTPVKSENKSFSELAKKQQEAIKSSPDFKNKTGPSHKYNDTLGDAAQLQQQDVFSEFKFDNNIS